jgi:hypothetical protein
MTYSALKKYLEDLTEAQLEGAVFVNVGDSFFTVEDIHVASGDGDYLFMGECYFLTEDSPLKPKHEVD